jgi:hypothetical protein
MAAHRKPKAVCRYACDTEATTQLDYEEDGHVYAYLLDMQRIDSDHVTCNKNQLCGFKDKLQFCGPQTMRLWTHLFLERIPEKAEMWYYNARYDVGFIIDYLIRYEGYTSDTWEDHIGRKEEARAITDAYRKEHPEYREIVTVEDGEIVGRKQKGVPKGLFKDIQPRKVIHPIKSGSGIILVEIYNERGHVLTIYDVGNKWTNLPDWDERNNCPMSGVQAIARMYGMSKTELPIVYRGDNYWPGEVERTRCAVDTEIIVKAMKDMLDMGLTKATLAADAWNIYQSVRKLGMGLCKTEKAFGNAVATLKLCGFTDDELEAIVDQFPADGILDNLQEEWQFPEDMYTIDIRASYQGGVCMVNPRYQNIRLGPDHWTRVKYRIAHLDCNSMHPNSMLQPMPYGTCWRSKDPEGEFYIMSAWCTFTLKPGKFPTVCKRGRNDDTVWLTEGDRELTMTSWDWEWFKKNYDYTIIGGTHCLNWHTRINESLVAYVNHFSDMKAHWKEAKKQCQRDGDTAGAIKADIMYYLAKILMNSLYGKWGQDPVKPWESCDLEDGYVSYRKSNTKRGEYDAFRTQKYLPMACSITGCSRNNLWTQIEKIGWDRFLYGDTDSIFFLTACQTNDELLRELKELGVDVHPTKLGAWDLEHGLDGLDDGEIITEAKFLRAKVYVLVTADGEITVKMAGCPIEARKRVHDIDELYFGKVFENARLLQQMVEGGPVLIESDFTLTEHGI